MRKITLFAAIFAVAVAAAAMPAAFGKSIVFGAKAESVKTADVWILAGQSNAAGYSNIQQTVHGQDDSTYKYADKLAEDDARNGAGYSEVLYYGATNVAATAAMPTLSVQNVKMGLGQNFNYIGPELGMAQFLSTRYSVDSPAAIIKYAVGGTYLGDFGGAGRETQDFGNWASPSMTERAQAQGQKLHANNGLLYNRLLSVTESGLAALRAKGYVPKVKGYIFMQGEADAGRSDFANAYADNLEAFITDLRSDVAELADDADAVKRPFVVGKICPSGLYGSYISTVRAAQDSVAAKLSNVFTVETEDLLIRNTDGTTNGSDDWHFNGWDMYQLGKRFATTATKHLAKYTFAVTADTGGSVSKTTYLSNGETIQIDYMPARGKRLDKVLLNGADVTQDVVHDGAIAITPKADSPSYNEIAIRFTDAAEYTLTVDVGAGGKIKRSISGSAVYEGETLVVEPIPSTGFETDSVLVNGQAVECNDGNYAVTIVGDTTLQVTFKEIKTAATENDEGCKAAATTSNLGILATLLALLGTVAVLRRRTA